MTPLEEQALEAAEAYAESVDAETGNAVSESSYINGFLAAAEPREKRIAELEARQTARQVLDTKGEWKEMEDGEVVLLMIATMPDLLEENDNPARDRLARLICKSHELLCRAQKAEKRIAELEARVKGLEATINKASKLFQLQGDSSSL